MLLKIFTKDTQHYLWVLDLSLPSNLVTVWYLHLHVSLLPIFPHKHISTQFQYPLTTPSTLLTRPQALALGLLHLLCAPRPDHCNIMFPCYAQHCKKAALLPCSLTKHSFHALITTSIEDYSLFFTGFPFPQLSPFTSCHQSSPLSSLRPHGSCLQTQPGNEPNKICLLPDRVCKRPRFRLE